MGFFPGCLENRLKAEEIEDKRVRRLELGPSAVLELRLEILGKKKQKVQRS